MRSHSACWLLVLLCAGVMVSPACSRSRSATRPDTTPAPAVAAPVPAPPPPQRRTGRLATEDTLQALVPGKTTRPEVRERFGTPDEVVFSPGMETFIYRRSRRTGWISRGTEVVESFTLHFDAGGLLKDFEYRYSGD
jgi:hypothetical protein